MITWLDALLVTVWAAVTVLGLRRGLGGALWAVLTVVGVLLAGFSPWPGLAVLLSVVVGLGASWLASQVFRHVVTQTWHLGVGAVSGFVVGFFVVGALALSFPVKVIGSQGSYPSSDLPAPVYYASFNSFFVQHLSGAWSGNVWVKRLWLPDQTRSAR
ncbi:hypothetical protein [Deinococcus peraridilitoris]|uniref:Colicin V production protein n=1 Tax=Deinococcus peraridilitoris (strain DSM 19664 / LMG 22246 / CIP 109416 / KR-200) TaxID=937777 RepID=K9ZZX7_DEIPD|nr:hypothetical protein [Deinococcus peraridilitoris]AFZ66325.1 hypothetical protein Deipe_0746 [Deinococcus peraridilitoris DSM 19664]